MAVASKSRCSIEQSSTKVSNWASCLNSKVNSKIVILLMKTTGEAPRSGSGVKIQTFMTIKMLKTTRFTWIIKQQTRQWFLYLNLGGQLLRSDLALVMGKISLEGTGKVVLLSLGQLSALTHQITLQTTNIKVEEMRIQMYRRDLTLLCPQEVAIILVAALQDISKPVWRKKKLAKTVIVS